MKKIIANALGLLALLTVSAIIINSQRVSGTVGGGGGAAGSQHQVNGVNVSTNDPINFQDGTTELDWSNPSAGNIQAVLGTGSVADSKLASNYSGIGSCTNQVVKGVNDNTPPSCGEVQTGEVANDAVTYGKLQNVTATNRFLGRITSGSGDAEELTGTQATTLIDVFTSALKGLAPSSGGGTTNFLRADGTWAAPGGGGGTTITVTRLTANQSTTGTAPVNIPNLGVTMNANTNYIVRCTISWGAAATTTGIGLSWTSSGGMTSTSARLDYIIADVAGNGVLTRSFTATTTEAVSTGSLGTTDTTAMLTVLIRVSAIGGALIPRFRSEVSGSNVTVFADSHCAAHSF